NAGQTTKCLQHVRAAHLCPLLALIVPIRRVVFMGGDNAACVPVATTNVQPVTWATWVAVSHDLLVCEYTVAQSRLQCLPDRLSNFRRLIDKNDVVLR